MAKSDKIRFKLISNILILLSVAIISTGYLVYKISEHELIKETKLKLIAINNSKVNSIKSYFSESLRTIDALGKETKTIDYYLKHKGSTDEKKIEKISNLKRQIKERLNTIKNEHNLHNVGIIEINGTPLVTAGKFKSLNPKISNTGKIYKTAFSNITFTNAYELNKRTYISIIAPLKHFISSGNNNKRIKKTIALLIIEIDIEPVHQILQDDAGTNHIGESIIINETHNSHTGRKIHTFLSPPKDFPELISKNVQSKGYKTEAIQRCFKNKDIGFIAETTDYKGTQTFASWKYIKEFNWGIVTFVPTETSKKLISELTSMVKILIFAILGLTSVIVIVIISRFTKPLSEIRNYIESLNRGVKPHKISTFDKNEIGQIVDKLEVLVKRRNSYNAYAKNMAEGKLDISLEQAADSKDELAINLTKVHDRLDEINKENERRKWASEGFNIHSDIMMENSGDLSLLGHKLISSIVNYLKAHQGAIFTLKKVKNDRFENDDNKDTTAFELAASYAFTPERSNKSKLFHLGQGLVGQCALEKKTIHLENTPLVQSNIESGLGNAPASNLLLIPLKINEEVLGVLEIGTFKKFEPFEVDFLEQLGESMASSLLTLISNERTKDLLKENQLVLTLLKQKEKEVLKNQSNLVDLLENLQEDYKSSLQDIHKLKKENQDLRKRIK